MSVRFIRMVLFALLAISVAFSFGCASKRITQFSDFATAGQAYIQAADKLIDEAAAATVDVSSVTLVDGRDAFDRDERYSNLSKSRRRDFDLVTEMFLIKKHNRYLNTYFQGLKELAGDETGTEISASAMNAFNSIVALRPSVEDIPIGGSSVGDFIQPVTSFIVRGLKKSALEAELRERGETIYSELELQRAAMEAIGSWLIELRKTQQSITEDEVVNKPYAEANNLPAGWERKRREFLMKEFSTIETLQKAEEAAEKLRDAFTSLSQGTSSLTELISILDDANQVLTLLESKEEE